MRQSLNSLFSLSLGLVGLDNIPVCLLVGILHPSFSVRSIPYSLTLSAPTAYFCNYNYNYHYYYYYWQAPLRVNPPSTHQSPHYGIPPLMVSVSGVSILPLLLTLCALFEKALVVVVVVLPELRVSSSLSLDSQFYSQPISQFSSPISHFSAFA